MKLGALGSNVTSLLQSRDGQQDPNKDGGKGDKMTVSRIRFEVNRARKFIDKLEKNVNILEQEKAVLEKAEGSPNRRRTASPLKQGGTKQVDQDAVHPGYGASSASGSEAPSQQDTI